jgi:predicted GTPase
MAMELSDQNKEHIQFLLERLAVRENRTIEIVDYLADNLIGLVEKESLQSQAGEFYVMLAQVYLEMGHVKKAIDYAERSVDRRKLFNGPDSDQVEKATGFLEYLYTLEQ